ncbi:MAG: Na(+)-translocating NADH-quinone reductase subunit C [Pseudomonadota bacterium]|nr:Na(+)-translocating NADH-quinone reductase subunit C [Pseudomonadota bacterium]
MSSSKETIQHTLIVAFLVCLVCSVVVAGAAVALKPMQQKNKDLDRKTNVLAAAGMLEPGTDVEAAFKQFDVRIVDLETGEFVEGLSPEEVAPKVAARNEELSHPLSASEDPASIKRKPKYAAVYVLTNEDGIERLVLPVYGYGLWSTLYGYMAVSGDLNTVAGIGFYEHAETPGLGGEVDNPNWKAQWEGKELYNAEGELAIRVLKGGVDTSRAGSEHRVSGLSGATLTTKGVDNLVRYWLGPEGFGPLLANLKQRGGEV